jgi:regulator of sirC expression with transglutaminase-like and TPR domain
VAESDGDMRDAERGAEAAAESGVNEGAAPGDPAAGIRIPILAPLLAGVLGVVVFAHWGALSSNALCWDDNHYLTENRLVRDPGWPSAKQFLAEILAPSTVRGYYQPLTMISLMLDYAMGGRPEDLFVFRRTSLTLHVLNTALIVLILYRLFGSAWAAAMVGLLFGVHPLTVEPIPWAGERKTLLATFFALLSLLSYLRYAKRGGVAAMGGAWGLYLLALMAKPTTTPIPVCMLLLDYWPLNRLNLRSVLEKVPFFALGAVSMVVTFVSQNRTAGTSMPSEYGPWRIPMVLCHNVVFYFRKMVWPTNITPHYPFPDPMHPSNWPIMAGIIGTAVLMVALLVSWRRTRAWVTGFLFFFIAIFPTMQIVGFSDVIASDKFAYLPALGVLLPLAYFIGRAWNVRTQRGASTIRIALVVCVVGLSALEVRATKRYLVSWRDSPTLFGHMAKLAPESASVYFHLGTAFLYSDDLDSCIDALSRSIELKGDQEIAYNNRGNCYGKQKMNDEALADYTRAIEMSPNLAEAYANRANIYQRKKQFDLAIADCDTALEMNPGMLVALHNRAVTYFFMKDYVAAWADVKTARAGGGAFHPRFLELLQQAMPEPGG